MKLTHHHPCSLVCLLLLLAYLATTSGAGEVWTENSFADFIDGSFLDGGSNLYVSAAGRLQMINRWDLNGDGYLDVVIPSGHGHTEKEDAFIYLNNGRGDIEGRSLIRIPTNGGREAIILDFNKDGFNDLAICNYDNGITYQTDTYVYYGSEQGFTASKRTILPTIAATRITAGDFNGDGWADLFIANRWQDNYLDNQGEPMSFIYWNSPHGFSSENRRAFAFSSAVAEACDSMDLDRDGIDDLIVSAGGKTYLYPSARSALQNEEGIIELSQGAEDIAAGDVNGDGWKELGLVFRNSVSVLFGSETGFSMDRKVELKASNARGAVFADFNQDGYDDLAVANYAGDDGATWITSTVYFSQKGDFEKIPKINLPTMGASGVCAGDLNGDGYPELVISNERVTNQAAIPSFVYWNEGGSFHPGHHTQLDTQGSVSNTIGDVNHDGLPDVLFCNHEGGFRDGPSNTSIYWGDGTRGYTSQRKTDIPTHYMGGGAHADLDDDGFVDLVLVQSRFISGAREDIFGRVIILWGSKDGFSRRTNLSLDSAGSGVRIDDLNRDGWLDLLVGGEVTDPHDPTRKGLATFWGNPNGFSREARSIIEPVAGSSYRAPLTADLDKDGDLDLAVQFERGRVEFYYGKGDGNFIHVPRAALDLETEDFFGYINTADLNRDGWLDLLLPVRSRGNRTDTPSYVAYGGPSGFSRDRIEAIRSCAGTDGGIGDLNKDGWLDLILPSYKDNFKRDVPSFLYWGGPSGYLAAPPQLIPTHSSAGIEIADYDGDGWLDALFINHCKDGSTTSPGPQNHLVPSYLLWGGPEGIHEEVRTELPGVGPHALNCRDTGNQIDRGLYEDYISSPHPIPSGMTLHSLDWRATTPLGTAVMFQVRSAVTREGLENTAWVGLNQAEGWITQSSTELTGINGNWIQYRARLTTPNAGPTPYLEEVMLSFE